MIHKNFGSWVQCSKRNPCPQCGTDHDCTLTTDGLVSKCMKQSTGTLQRDGRLVSIKRVSQCGEAGQAVKQSKPAPSTPRLKTREVELLIRQSQTALSPHRLTAASKELGVSERSLKLMGVGFDADSGCVSFPMYDGDSKPVGLRLRRSNPKPGQQRYFCVRGSRNGLFIPSNFDPKPIPLTIDPAPLVLVLPEGPTDVCAALDLGLMAVGRFSNAGGQGDIIRLIQSAPGPLELVLLADRDGAKFMQDGTPYSPGWEGALAVALAVRSHPNVSTLKVLMPPGNAKDLRQWFKEGGTAEVLAHCIAGGEVVTSAWLTRKRDALFAVKEKAKKHLTSKTASTPADALRMAKAELMRAAG